jgi:hypothetical protein
MLRKFRDAGTPNLANINLPTRVNRQWHRYSHRYRNDVPYPYLQGYVPVYPRVHVLQVLRVLTGMGTPIHYITLFNLNIIF